MGTRLSWVNTRFLKFLNLFEQADKPKFFGLGQFVLLITLAPFIFNLSLYNFGESKKVASHYEFPADRFESLPSLLSDKGERPNSKPTAPRYRYLSSSERKQLNTCNHYPLHQLFYAKYCNNLRKKQKAYSRDNNRKKKAYNKKLKAYKAFNADRKKHLAEIRKLYDTFDQNNPKPELISEHIEIKQFSRNSISSVINHSIAGNDWQKVTFPLWLLGALLIIPTVLLCIKRNLWGLLAFGLLVPSYNYIITIPSFLFGLESLASWKIISTLVPQVAFIWFAIHGHIRSKSYGYFLLLLVICSLLASLTNSNESFNLMQAQLPILVFIATSCMARLLVKIVQENTYLFKRLGWKKSLRTGLHSILLWLPLALLATPFFYITETVVPKHVVNQLHTNHVLVFNHKHNLLDNALQSTAVKTDDAMYAWYLITQNIKKDIYLKANQLERINLKESVERNFDNVVPYELKFDDYVSDAGFIKKQIVELSVDASEDSTNKAFKNLRSKMRRQLSNLAANHAAQFKTAVKKGKSEALASIDSLYQEGQDTLLETNHATQTSLWWTINYATAAHQLTILLFIFVCIKSLMYVFSRVSFNRDTNTFITLGDLSEKIEEEKPLIKRTGLQYLIHADSEHENLKYKNADAIFYISRRFQCRGKAPKYTIPQPFHAPIARLFNGSYSMNKVVMRQGDDTVSCTASQGIEFFEWDLRYGESIVFDFHNFVGMSESVKISTLISTRISSLLIGKMIYSQATGPGKLILMTKGRAEITDSMGNGGSLPAERLVAMQTNTRLHIDSELDIINIYLSTAYVRPAGGGQAIVDVDSQRGTKTGLGSFLKRFIFPG